MEETSVEAWPQLSVSLAMEAVGDEDEALRDPVEEPGRPLRRSEWRVEEAATATLLPPKPSNFTFPPFYHVFVRSSFIPFNHFNNKQHHCRRKKEVAGGELVAGEISEMFPGYMNLILTL